MYDDHNECAYAQEHGLLDKGLPKASTLIGKGACSAVDFDQRDDAKEEENNPYHTIAHEE